MTDTATFQGHISCFCRWDYTAKAYVENDAAKIESLRFTAKFDTAEAAQAYVEARPKMLRLKRHDAMVSFGLSFKENGVTGSANETGDAAGPGRFLRTRAAGRGRHRRRENHQPLDGGRPAPVRRRGLSRPHPASAGCDTHPHYVDKPARHRRWCPYYGDTETEHHMTPAERIAYNAKRHADRADKAAAALAAGFASEANRKLALQNLGAAWDALKWMALDALIAERQGRAPTLAESDAYSTLLMDLHHWLPKTSAAYPAWAADVEALVDLRAAIKAAPVEPTPPREDHPLLGRSPAAAGGGHRRACATAGRSNTPTRSTLGRKLKGGPLVYVGPSVGMPELRPHGLVRLNWSSAAGGRLSSTIAAAYDRLVREGAIIEKA